MGFVLQNEGDGFSITTDDAPYAGRHDLAGLRNAVAAVPSEFGFVGKPDGHPGLWFVREGDGQRTTELLEDLRKLKHDADSPVSVTGGRVQVQSREPAQQKRASK